MKNINNPFKTVYNGAKEKASGIKKGAQDFLKLDTQPD